MHTQKYFQIDDSSTINEFIRLHNFGQLVSVVDAKPFVTHIPFLFDAELQTLACHIARPNPQWREIESQDVLVTFQGVHGYVSPSWYTDPGVPTWNYQAVHVYGKCRIVSDKEVQDIVERLTKHHESEFADPWKLDYDPAMLNAIVGLEISITDVQCKFKLSQNRSAADRKGVMENSTNEKLVQAMRKMETN